jgi:hypothetical protein
LAARGNTVFDEATNEHALQAHEKLHVVADITEELVSPLDQVALDLETVEMRSAAIFRSIADCALGLRALFDPLDSSVGATQASATKFTAAAGHYATAKEEMEAVINGT